MLDLGFWLEKRSFYHDISFTNLGLSEMVGYPLLDPPVMIETERTVSSNGVSIESKIEHVVKQGLGVYLKPFQGFSMSIRVRQWEKDQKVRDYSHQEVEELGFEEVDFEALEEDEYEEVSEIEYDVEED